MNSPSDRCHSETGLGCQQIEERIHDLLDQRRSPLEDPIVREHRDHCRQCGDLIADFDALARGDSLLGLPVDTGQRDSTFNPWVMVASISALLLVMLTSNAWFPGDGGSEGGTEVATMAVFAPVVMDMSEPVRSLNLFEITDMAEIAEIKEIAEIVEIVEIADSAISSEHLLNPFDFEEIGSHVEPYQEYLGVTAELPGIDSISDSVNLAIQFFSTISRMPSDKKSGQGLPDGLKLSLGVSFSTYACA